jgi:hypothetical protein
VRRKTTDDFLIMRDPTTPLIPAQAGIQGSG